MDIRNIDIGKVAKTVELDAGRALPGLWDSLAQAKRGEFVAVHAPKKIIGDQKARRPLDKWCQILSLADSKPCSVLTLGWSA